MAKYNHGLVLTDPNSVPVIPANRPKRRVNQRQAEHVGEGEDHGPPSGRRSCGWRRDRRPADDRRRDGDHRIDAGSQARQHAARENDGDRGQRIPGKVGESEVHEHEKKLHQTMDRAGRGPSRWRHTLGRHRPRWKWTRSPRSIPELSPERQAATGRQRPRPEVAGELRQAIAKYKDTAVAIADGYQMFLPNLKNQKIYHFTNNGRGLEAAFHFDPSKPTSLLYKRGPDGKLILIGAMYTMPKNACPTPERPRSAQHRALAQARELVHAEEGRRTTLARDARRPSGVRSRKPDRDEGGVRRGARRLSSEPVRLDDPRQRVRGQRPRDRVGWAPRTRPRRASHAASGQPVILRSAATKDLLARSGNQLGIVGPSLRSG